MKVKVASVFPYDVTRQLVEASEVDRHIAAGESLPRQKAVQRAINYAQHRCPEIFKEEVANDNKS
jgi:hypothetical protein